MDSIAFSSYTEAERLWRDMRIKNVFTIDAYTDITLTQSTKKQ